METKVLNIEGIGTISITRRKGTHQISLRVKPDGSVQVNHPWFASDHEVKDFIIQHTNWIITHQKKMIERRVFFQPDAIFNTKSHRIQISQVENGILQAGTKGEQVVITIPSVLEFNSDKVQNFIKKVITEVCRREAKIYLPSRTRELALQHGFSYQKIFVKNLKSKWGSCSSQGNINLNLSLMLLPNHLIDYIILHELSHTREHNHGPGFWKLLNAITGNKAKDYDREIRKNFHII